MTNSVSKVSVEATPSEATTNVTIAAEGMEPYEAAGLRAASTLCAIDGPGELVPMTHIAPVLLHGKVPVILHFYYAAMPPPPGPLEDADIEDEEDYYGELGQG